MPATRVDHVGSLLRPTYLKDAFQRFARQELSREDLGAVQSRAIISTQNGNVRMGRDIPRYARLIESGALTADPIITRTYGLDEINQAMENSRSHADVCGIIIPSR